MQYTVVFYGMLPVILLLAASAAFAADLPAGQIIDRVTCAADASHSYALFVPADYTPSRSWPVIFAFDPGGRGRTPVERYVTTPRSTGSSPHPCHLSAQAPTRKRFDRVQAMRG